MTKIYKSPEAERAVRERYLKLLRRWPVPNQQLRAPTREGETFIVASGPTDAPPLLLLHGSGSNSAMWMPVIARWSADFRVYAVDMIGEPGLSAPSRPALASDAYTLWLDDVMQSLSLRRASILGSSLGGWLALDYATRRPERVERLVLVCPGGVGRQKIGFLFQALFWRMFGAWGRRKALEAALGPLPAGASDQLAAVQRLSRHYRYRRDRLPIFSDHALAKLTMPVLAIVGGRDAMLDSHGTKRRLERAAAHARVCLLPEAGHLIPDQTSRILAFLMEAVPAEVSR